MLRPDSRRAWYRSALLMNVLLLASAVGLLGTLSGFTNRAADVPVSIGATLDPAELTVPPGTTVTWTATDSARHRLRTTSGPVEFDSDYLPAGGSWSYTFNTLGVVSYVDHEHESLTGMVTVREGAPLPGGGGGATGGGTSGGGGGRTPPPPPPPSTATVHLAGQAFSPHTVTVALNGTVTWTNDDGTPHNVTSNTGAFTSPILMPGNTYSFRFTEPGTYNYVCTFHGGMSGTVIVPSTTGSVPPPPPPVQGIGGSGRGPVAGQHQAPPPPVSGGMSKTVEIQVREMSFGPATATAQVGDTISWVNVGSVPHTVTAGNGSFDHLLAPGQRFNFRLTEQGRIPYRCIFHPGMDGVLVIGPAPANVVVPAGSGAGTSTGDGSTAQPGNPVTHGALTAYEVQVKDNSFDPAMLNMHVGDTVTWVNVGATPHTVTASNGLFDKTLAPGEKFSYTVKTVGDLDYVCTPHTDMFGMLMVAPTASGANTAHPSLTLGTIPKLSMGLAGTGLLLALGLAAARRRGRDPQLADDLDDPATPATATGADTPTA